MSKKPKRKLSRFVILLDTIAFGIAFATLFGLLGRLNWFLDLFSHFRVQYMQLCLPLIGIYLWKRMNVRALIVVLLAVFNYSFVLPLYFGKPAPATNQPARAMLMNILASNGNTEQVLSAVHDADPDLLLLEEVTPKWAMELQQLNETYPYRIAEPQEGNFGIMLLSKVPLERGEVVEIGTAGLPSIVTEVHFPQGVISVIGTHPLPPAGKEYSRLRNIQLRELPKYAGIQHNPVLLIGDLNTSQWSPHFRDLIAESGLIDSTKGFGFQPSWAGNMFLKIPIDHVLHSDKIIIHNRMIGPDVGSDHLPVIVDFSIK